MNQSMCSQQFVPWRKSRSFPWPSPRALEASCNEITSTEVSYKHGLEQPLCLLSYYEPLPFLVCSVKQSELVCCKHRGAEGPGMGLEFL